MTPDDVCALYGYNEWANDRFSSVLQTLDGGQLTAPIESSFSSLLATFAHVVAAEWVWLERWQGRSPSSFPEWLSHPSFGEVRSRLSIVETERAPLLAGLSEDALRSELGYRTLSGDPHSNRLLDVLLHVVNHSTYHRGQLTTLLRQVGAAPVATDYVLFRREHPL